MKKKYKNFKDIFKYGYIGIPKKLLKSKKPFYGTFQKFKEKYPNFNTNKKIPIVLYMHGSKGLGSSDIFAKYVTNNVKAIFFAPNSFAIKNRPVYKSPAKQSEYKKVHNLRQKEIKYSLKKIKKLKYIDNQNIFLMGNSEGALATAIFKSNEFKSRIIIAFSCESNYYYPKFKSKISKNEPILNIMGSCDEYFGLHSTLNKNYDIKGHSIDTFRKHKNAKIVILSNTKHNVLSNIYLKNEIINFLKNKIQ
jgi:predicted esterase